MRKLFRLDSYLLKEGTVLGGVLMLSGSCIGVGMLAMPILTGLAGFLPSLFVFLLSWAFMTTTALLMLEANLWFSNEKNILSITERVLGKPFKYLAWATFLFLFYSLLVAYLSKGGEILELALPFLKGKGSTCLVIFSAFFVYLGPWLVDYFNRVCILGLFISYFFLVFSGLEHAQLDYLKYQDWSYTFYIVPFLIITFGYHNMIPTVHNYLGGDRKKMVQTLVLGGLLPFFIFSLWEP